MERKEFIRNICDYLDKNIKDKEGNKIPYAVCAPTINSDGTKNGARLYCFGGAPLLEEIHDNSVEHLNNDYVFKGGVVKSNLPSQYINESEFAEFVSQRKKYNSMSFDDLWSDTGYRDFLGRCVNIAENWSILQNKEERSIETRIVQKSRENRTSCVVDMEFNILQTWNCKIKGIDVIRSPRIDLVVYDETDQSFGLIELKNVGDTDMNAQNMRKHYADFTAVLECDHLEDILQNLHYRTRWLKDNGFITLKNELPDTVNKIWYGFLFVGDSIDSYKSLYTKDLLRKDSWVLKKEEKSGQIKVSDLRDRYEDMIKNERARYKFCNPDELDSINLDFNNMISFDELWG